MIMEIQTGSGGDSVLFARYTGGGILSSSTKKSGGDSVRGGFCPTLLQTPPFFEKFKKSIIIYSLN